MNLDMIANWFAVIGVHPVLGSFFSGALAAFLLLTVKVNSRQERSLSKAFSARGEHRHSDQTASCKVQNAAITISFHGSDIAIPAQQSALIMAMIRSGRTIEAIKAIRECSGLGLAEAKQFVELLAKHSAENE